MPTVRVTPNLQRHISTESADVPGATAREVLSHYFERFPKLKSYVLDDSGAVRKHMVVFVDGESVMDRVDLSDAVSPDGEVFIMQSLSGG